jgi:DNA-binding FadR family transcriptional regulator
MSQIEGRGNKVQFGKRETLTSQLVREITERIEAGRYPRGEQLPTEKDLIDEFGVSRTVVREAIANLRASGFVSTRQGIGAFVLQSAVPAAFRIEEQSLSVIEDVVRALELRIAIESEAAALAAMRRTEKDLAAMRESCVAMEAGFDSSEDTIAADMAFHRAVAAGTQNDHFLKIFNYLGEVLIPRTRLATHKFDAAAPAEYMARIGAEHRRIFSAIEANDPDGARAGMRMHLGGSRERLLHPKAPERATS